MALTLEPVREGLGHDGGVHDHRVHAAALDEASGARRFDRHCEQGLHAFLANALSPACEARWIHGQFGLQVLLATEELPIRVLQPGVDDRFV